MGYEVAWQQPNGVIRRHFGRVAASELLAALAKVHGDPRFDMLRYVIIDLRDCNGLEVSAVELVELAAIDNAAATMNPNIRVAVVATLPELVAAANAYANTPLTAYATRVFGTLAAAKSWLGLLTG